jgi:hypothetical protein
MIKMHSTGPLAAWRVGLSGAIPERESWGGRALDREIQRLVAALAERVLRDGGHLVHGTHPSFTPVLCGQARAFYGSGAGSGAGHLLTLVRSALWPDDNLRRDVAAFRAEGSVELIETAPVAADPAHPPSPDDDQTRNLSLTAMRGRLLEEMNALVLVGGKRQSGTGRRPGLVEELELARDRGLPCFLLGGFGGIAADLATDPTALPPLGNGLSEEDNTYLLATDNYAGAVSLIGAALAALGSPSSP